MILREQTHDLVRHNDNNDNNDNKKKYLLVPHLVRVDVCPNKK